MPPCSVRPSTHNPDQPPFRRLRRPSEAESSADTSHPVTTAQNAAAIDHTAAESFMVVQSEPSVTSRSPDGNGEGIQNSPIPSDLYAPYEGVITPEEIESLMQIFHHSIYPLYVSFAFSVKPPIPVSFWLVYALTNVECHTFTGLRSKVKFVNNSIDLIGQYLL